MHIDDILEKVKDSKTPYKDAMAIDPMFWVAFIRRHKANCIDVHFMDKEIIAENDVMDTVSQVAEFFGLPIPVVKEKADTLAEIITNENAEECELYYNLKMMLKAGINNKATLKLAFVHEISHQLLYKTRFMLFENELWIQELAADLLVGGFSNAQKDVATGKYKYILSEMPASLTHPDGKLREKMVVYGRNFIHQLRQQGKYHGIMDMLAGLPAFVYSHYDELQEAWDNLNLKEMMREPKKKEPKPIDIESLPDTNLIKQAYLKHKKEKEKESET